MQGVKTRLAQTLFAIDTEHSRTCLVALKAILHFNFLVLVLVVHVGLVCVVWVHGTLTQRSKYGGVLREAGCGADHAAHRTRDRACSVLLLQCQCVGAACAQRVAARKQQRRQVGREVLHAHRALNRTTRGGGRRRRRNGRQRRRRRGHGLLAAMGCHLLVWLLIVCLLFVFLCLLCVDCVVFSLVLFVDSAVAME